MNRNDWEKQVFGSDLTPSARLVALAVGSFGNWKDDRSVWPSATAIADMAGMHRNTAQKYLDAFVEQGWLRVVKLRPGNIREYELLEAVATASGILAKSARANNLPQVEATGCYSEEGQLLQGSASVATAPVINLKEPTNMNLKNTTTVSDEPVEIDLLEVRGDTDPSLTPTLGEPSLTPPPDRYAAWVQAKQAEEARKKKLLKDWNDWND